MFLIRLKAWKNAFQRRSLSYHSTSPSFHWNTTPKNPIVWPSSVKSVDLQDKRHRELFEASQPARELKKDKGTKTLSMLDLQNATSTLDYLIAKGFSFTGTAVSKSAYESYKTYLARSYTYSLTLASVWNEMGLHKIDNPKICMVGPEFEIYIHHFWRELFHLVERTAEIHYVGPFVRRCDPLMADTLKDGSHWHAGLVEEMSPSLIDSMDAFVAFMPGAGTNPNYTWKEAFGIIRSTMKPLLLTAHLLESDRDLDIEFWKKHFGEELTYRENRFASLPEDPKDTVAGLPPFNGYLCVVNGENTTDS